MKDYQRIADDANLHFGYVEDAGAIRAEDVQDALEGVETYMLDDFEVQYILSIA